jgi:eukaryotic-like serine/threonine-protein kinase
MALERGTRLGRYEIRSLVGEGGMGEVYRAWDTELERVVALKVLPPQIAADRDRLSRFLQEARAASKIGGAHAAHIYEIKETEGLHFIAMEYAEGQSLDKHIGGKPLEVAEVARLGIQIAEALEEAHARGVTHRDIKPANIIVTPRGGVKVLDFGLAKINRPEEQHEDGRSPHVKTDPGMVMGTVSYMSPEQALAERDIDHRTDIFSLGVVLYEMATGRVPFAGDSAGRTIDNIIHFQPEAMARFNYAVPVELDVIVRKCLRKSRDERYQTVRDLLNDLRSLKSDLDFIERERSVPPELRHSGMISSVRPAGTQSGPLAGQSQSHPSGSHSGASSEQPTMIFGRDEVSGAGPARTVAGGPRATRYAEPATVESRSGRRQALTFVAATLAALLLGWGGFLAYRMARGGRDGADAADSLQAMKITRLTSTGKATNAVVSPDGQFVVHVIADGGRQSLWLRQTSAASDREIVPPADAEYLGVSFTNDGSSVYYVRSEKNSQFGVLYQVPSIGGREGRELLRDIDSAVSFSPDGQEMAFVRNYPNRSESALMVARSDGAGERRLTVFRQPHFIWGPPAWSPDGARIACAVAAEAGGLRFDVITVSTSDGSQHAVPNARFGDVRRMSWLADGATLVLSATEQANSPFQIYQLSTEDGALRRVTNDLNRYVGVSLTADGRSLVTVQVDRRSNIWLAPGSGPVSSRARQITSGVTVEGLGGLAWTPDGRIVYSSQSSGNWDIWIMNSDGTEQRQLTRDSDQNLWPSVSPDGRFVVFESYRGGGSHVWRMNIDGTEQRQMTTGSGEFTPQFSADGNWIIYQSLAGGSWNLWRVPAGGGQPVQMASNVMTSPALSPDGRHFAYGYWDEAAQTAKIAVLPFEGGPAVAAFDNIPLNIKWTADGRALAYVDTRGGISNIWAQPLAGGQPRQLTDFESDEVFGFAWSSDGKQLAVARGFVSRDVVLIKDFR